MHENTKIGTDNLPLEKELVNFILLLDNDDVFFKKSVAKNLLKNEFTKAGITLNPVDINEEKTKSNKKWFESVGKQKLIVTVGTW